MWLVLPIAWLTWSLFPMPGHAHVIPMVACVLVVAWSCLRLDFLRRRSGPDLWSPENGDALLQHSLLAGTCLGFLYWVW